MPVPQGKARRLQPELAHSARLPAPFPLARARHRMNFAVNFI
jgi:hypothetical protein